MGKRRPLEDRLWAKVDKNGPIPSGRPDLGPCWLWTAAITHGYGTIGDEAGKAVRAHRATYELVQGPVPTGLQLDHLCRVRRCVRPSHLEPVTQRENLLRGNGWAGRNARKTHCSKGHSLDPANTRLDPRNGGRLCNICHPYRGGVLKPTCGKGHSFDEANTYWDPKDEHRYCLTCRPGRGNGKFTRPDHCKRGHAWSEYSIYWTPRGERQCRLCRKLATERRAAKRKATAAVTV